MSDSNVYSEKSEQKEVSVSESEKSESREVLIEILRRSLK